VLKDQATSDQAIVQCLRDRRGFALDEEAQWEPNCVSKELKAKATLQSLVCVAILHAQPFLQQPRKKLARRIRYNQGSESEQGNVLTPELVNS
jgi:hypothetical protein